MEINIPYGKTCYQYSFEGIFSFSPLRSLRLYGESSFIVTTHGVNDIVSINSDLVTAYRVPEIFTGRLVQHSSLT
jgi:hypothetical protein